MAAVHPSDVSLFGDDPDGGKWVTIRGHAVHIDEGGKGPWDDGYAGKTANTPIMRGGSDGGSQGGSQSDAKPDGKSDGSKPEVGAWGVQLSPETEKKMSIGAKAVFALAKSTDMIANVAYATTNPISAIMGHGIGVTILDEKKEIDDLATKYGPAGAHLISAAATAIAAATPHPVIAHWMRFTRIGRMVASLPAVAAAKLMSMVPDAARFAGSMASKAARSLVKAFAGILGKGKTESAEMSAALAATFAADDRPPPDWDTIQKEAKKLVERLSRKIAEAMDKHEDDIKAVATAASGDDRRVEMADAAGEAAAWWNAKVYFDGSPVRRFDLARTLGSRSDMDEPLVRRLLESAEVVGGPSKLIAPWKWQEPVEFAGEVITRGEARNAIRSVGFDSADADRWALAAEFAMMVGKHGKPYWLNDGDEDIKANRKYGAAGERAEQASLAKEGKGQGKTGLGRRASKLAAAAGEKIAEASGMKSGRRPSDWVKHGLNKIGDAYSGVPAVIAKVDSDFATGTAIGGEVASLIHGRGGKREAAERRADWIAAGKSALNAGFWKLGTHVVKRMMGRETSLFSALEHVPGETLSGEPACFSLHTGKHGATYWLADGAEDIKANRVYGEAADRMADKEGGGDKAVGAKAPAGPTASIPPRILKDMDPNLLKLAQSSKSPEEFARRLAAGEGIGVGSAIKAKGLAYGGWVTGEGTTGGTKNPIPVWKVKGPGGDDSMVVKGQVDHMHGLASPQHFYEPLRASLTTGSGALSSDQPEAGQEPVKEAKAAAKETKAATVADPFAQAVESIRASSGKYPHEMTREEWFEKGKEYRTPSTNPKHPAGVHHAAWATPGSTEHKPAGDSLHRFHIRQAAMAGKAIPPEVLADYPGLSDDLKRDAERLSADQAREAESGKPAGKSGKAAKSKAGEGGDAKPAWQMTREDFRAKLVGDLIRDEKAYGKEKAWTMAAAKRLSQHDESRHPGKENTDEHFREVKDALDRGDAVPDSVLADSTYAWSLKARDLDAKDAAAREAAAKATTAKAPAAGGGKAPAAKKAPRDKSAPAAKEKEIKVGGKPLYALTRDEFRTLLKKAIDAAPVVAAKELKPGDEIFERRNGMGHKVVSVSPSGSKVMVVPMVPPDGVAPAEKPVPTRLSPKGTYQRFTPEASMFTGRHSGMIAKAIREGKKVPAKVAADARENLWIDGSKSWVEKHPDDAADLATIHAHLQKVGGKAAQPKDPDGYGLDVTGRPLGYLEGASHDARRIADAVKDKDRPLTPPLAKELAENVKDRTDAEAEFLHQALGLHGGQTKLPAADAMRKAVADHLVGRAAWPTKPKDWRGVSPAEVGEAIAAGHGGGIPRDKLEKVQSWSSKKYQEYQKFRNDMLEDGDPPSHASELDKYHRLGETVDHYAKQMDIINNELIRRDEADPEHVHRETKKGNKSVSQEAVASARKHFEAKAAAGNKGARKKAELLGKAERGEFSSDPDHPAYWSTPVYFDGQPTPRARARQSMLNNGVAGAVIVSFLASAEIAA